MYAYCQNDPIGNIDPSGTAITAAAVLSVTGIVGGTALVVFGTAYLTNKDFKVAVDGAIMDLVNGVIDPTVDAIVARYSTIGAVAATAILYVVNIYQATVSKQSGKEKASDAPSWAKGQRPNLGEQAKDFAKRMLDAKYGEGNWPKGPGSEYSKIVKWAQRSLGLK